MQGKNISHYRIVGEIGAGGMGIVYRAEDTKLGRAVALKFITPRGIEGADEKARFLHEAQAAASLSHPNICVVHEIDEADGRLFMAMKYVEAKSLKDWIASLSPMLVYSTPTDMVRWMDALYRRKAVLDEETLAQMLDFTGPVRGEPLMKGYGLGVVDINLGLILPEREHVRVYGHLGNQYGYMTFIGYFPEYGVSMAIMSNRGGDAGSTQAIMTVGGAVIDALLGYVGGTRRAMIQNDL